jgi:hypothetical protein
MHPTVGNQVFSQLNFPAFHEFQPDYLTIPRDILDVPQYVEKSLFGFNLSVGAH